MTIKTRQIAEIARATKRLHPEGLGKRIVVWPDGSYSEATSDNDLTAILHNNGSRTYPLVRIRYPMTRSQVALIIANAIEDAAIVSESNQ